MTTAQLTIVIILALTFGFFVWGRVRYDVVAGGALCLAVLSGLIPSGDAFLGFGHPATITVGAVLILSRALTASGAIDLIARRLIPETPRPDLRIAGLGTLAAALSAVINNVGALALLMPVAIQSSLKAKQSPALVLMPLAFASILGGLVTLIGTPPNIIIATFREQALGTPFSMFSFTPVGATVAVVGVLFVALLGWRLLPKAVRERAPTEDLFDIEGYLTEARVLKDSAANGQQVADLEQAAAEHDVSVIGVVRGGRQVRVSRREKLRTNDRLLVEGNPDGLDTFIAELGLKIMGTKGEKSGFGGDQLSLVEAVVPARSRVDGRTVESLRLVHRYGINLLAVARQGKPYRGRLAKLQFQPGDVLLLQGDADRLPETVATLGCLPLAERGLQFGKGHQAWLAIGIFAAAVGFAAAGLVGLPIAFATAVVAVVVSGILPVRDLYEGVDWPVIVLLGAMIPIGGALQTTGTTDLVAQGIVAASQGAPVALVLTLVLVVTMTLSDILNNAATAVIMAPIGLAIAERLGVNGDPFLMAVAVGASCAFLTPIGHQNNTLVMGPGGYAFGDYWRMGLPLEIVITVVAVPMILIVWPL
ncbi:MAG: SLC13 family permease [Alphaproteobacteria bacterium]|nr:SLC13 family permease [Alphaproteobacteria bacterium]